MSDDQGETRLPFGIAEAIRRAGELPPPATSVLDEPRRVVPPVAAVESVAEPGLPRGGNEGDAREVTAPGIPAAETETAAQRAPQAISDVEGDAAATWPPPATRAAAAPPAADDPPLSNGGGEPLRSVRLAERRAAVVTGLKNLKAERADAFLRGEDVTGRAAAIAAAEAELAALDDAGELAGERERVAAAASHAGKMKRWRAAVRQHQRDRLAAIGRAQRAFTEGAAALHEAEANRAAIGDLAQRIAHPLPLPLNASEANLRLSRLIAEKLGRLRPGHRNDFGVLSWGSAHLPPPEDWATGESAATGGAIEELVGENDA